MSTILCTLYNSLYLDKGLVLYDSLCQCSNDFKLYVLCMDDKCYEVLTELKQENHIPIRLKEMEEGDNALLTAKSNRPIGEYCWTCSSSLIRYILKKYNEPICTYIDADMYFYSDPQVLVDEMMNLGKSAMVIPHRFPAGKDKLAQKVGTYCVEFNTFVNNAEGLEVLEYWRNRCLECCSNIGDGIHWGDQKYLDELVENFPCVHVCQNNGAGVAPWNIPMYKDKDIVNTNMLFYKPLCINVPLIFYHYQSVKYINRDVINTGVIIEHSIDKRLVDNLYFPYLKKIESKKKMLESKYSISTLITRHPTSKKLSIWNKLLKKMNPINMAFAIKNRMQNKRLYIVNINSCLL